MKQAIQKAIEGGWEPSYQNERRETFYKTSPSGITLKGTSKDLNIAESLLDPLFWQALGKAMGWGGDQYTLESGRKEWVYKWHRFIDHLASGGTPDEFFKELLK